MFGEIEGADDIATGSVVDVTDRVEGALPADAEGTCTVFVRHTTAGVAVNEAEASLLGDVESFLGDLVPDEGWEHDRLDGNADSHLRALLLGPGETLPVADGALDPKADSDVRTAQTGSTGVAPTARGSTDQESQPTTTGSGGTPR